MISFVLLLFVLGSAQAEELRMNFNEQKRLLISPLATITHSSLTFENVGPHATTESAAGAEVGVRIDSISIGSRTFFAGFDLRQRFAERSLFETKAGIRLEYRPSPVFAIHGGWSFGDTVIDQSRSLQFNGTSASIGLSRVFTHFRVFTEFSWGIYEEGPGFIYITRRPGPEKLSTQTIAIGIEVPIETLLQERERGSSDARVRPTLEFQPQSGAL